MTMTVHNPILIRGAGDLATAIAVRLFRSGYRIILTDIDTPSMVRRSVAFAEAVYTKEHHVEGIRAVHTDIAGCHNVWSSGAIPLLVNVDSKDIEQLSPSAVVDAIIAKKNLGTYRNDKYYTIALGPGFTAPFEVDVVIETQRGHHLGRCIYEGSAQKNTGIPGNIEGYSIERVLRAPVAGRIEHHKHIGDSVTKGECICSIVNDEGISPVKAQMDGMIRGLIHPKCTITKGLKIGDIDPRNDVHFCSTVSDKGTALGGGVLEALLQANIYPQKIFADNTEQHAFYGMNAVLPHPLMAVSH